MKRLSLIIALAAMLGGQAYQVQAQGFTVNKKDGKTETYQAKDINKMQPVKITNSAIVDGQEQTSSESGVLIWMKDGSFKQYGESEFTNISMFGTESSDPTPGVRKVSQAYKDYVGSSKMRKDVEAFVESAFILEAMKWEIYSACTDNFNVEKDYQGDPANYDYTKFFEYAEEFFGNYDTYEKALHTLETMGVFESQTPKTRGIISTMSQVYNDINQGFVTYNDIFIDVMHEACKGMTREQKNRLWEAAYNEATAETPSNRLGCNNYKDWKNKIVKDGAGYKAAYIFCKIMGNNSANDTANPDLDLQKVRNASAKLGYGQNSGGTLAAIGETLLKAGVKGYAGLAAAGAGIISTAQTAYDVTEKTATFVKSLWKGETDYGKKAVDAITTVSNAITNYIFGKDLGTIGGEVKDYLFDKVNEKLKEYFTGTEKIAEKEIGKQNVGTTKVKDKDTKSPGDVGIVIEPDGEMAVIPGEDGEFTIPITEIGEFLINIIDQLGDKFTGTETVTDTTEDTEIEVSTTESEQLEVDPTIQDPEIVEDYTFTLVPSDIHFAADGGTIYVTVEGDGVEYIESTSSATWLGFSFMTGSRSLALVANPNADKDERSTSFWVAVMMKDGSVITRYFWAYQDGGAVEPEPDEPDDSEVLPIPAEIRNHMPIYEGNSLSDEFDNLESIFINQFELVYDYDDENYLNYVKMLLINSWNEEEQGPLTDERIEKWVNNARMRTAAAASFLQSSVKFNLIKKEGNRFAVQGIDSDGQLDEDWGEISIYGRGNKFTLYYSRRLEVGYWFTGACAVFSGVLEDGYIKDLYYTTYYYGTKGGLSSFYIVKDADGISEVTFKGSQSRAVSLSPIAPKTTKGYSIFAPWSVKTSKQ